MLRTELIRPLHELVAGHASERGDTVAFADRVRSVTYAELHVRTGRLAGHLAALRLHPGDRAVILQGNAVEVVESYLAVLRASGVAVPCNPAGSADELAHVLDDSGARVVLTDPAHLEQVLGLLPGRPSVTVLVTGDGPLPRGVHGYERLARTEPPQPARDDQDLDDVAFMLYTSGTTGSPKGVLSTQRSCLWSVAACYAPIVGLAAGDRVLWPLPLHHSLAHVLCVVGVTAVGATARLMEAFDPHDVLAELRAGSHTFLAGVPAMYHRLVAEARAAGGVPNSLTRALTAGSICPGPLRTAFEQTFGAPLLDGYGSTETYGLMAVNWPTGATVDGSCGLPVPGVALRLVGDDGRDVDAGAEGEVWVRGPNLMVGYHGRPDATAEAMPGGWYRTGDLGRFDEAGYLTITGRTRELIIRSGENVHPAEIEDVLLGVPGVADAAVTGRPHEVQGEVPVAFVVAGPGGVDPDAALAACRERLAAFKVPEELFEIDRVPRTSSGKITRHLLLDGPARLRATAGGRYRTVLRTSWTPLPSTRTGVRELPRRWSAAGGAPADLHGIAGVLDALGVDRDAEDPEITVLAAVVPPAPGRGLPDAASVAAATRDADARCRALLAGPGRVVAVTVGAVDPGGDPGSPDPAAAAVWGGLAALQAEHPDRLVLLDTDGTPASADALALAVGTDEPRLALREGVALVPRLAPAGPPAEGTAAPDPDPRGAVAVAGAPGPRTAALVRHLVRSHRLGQVLLCGPGGLGDPAIARLAGELDDLGAACAVHDTDPADPDALAAALASAPRPVTVLVHADGERGADLDAVLAGALHCDRASRSAARAPALVLTGTVRGALGSAGCGAESAAAAFLSALAAARVRDGLAGCVLAWGDPEPELPPAAGVGAVALEEVAAAADVALPARADAVVVRLEATGTGTPGPVPVLLRGLLETVAAAGPSDPVRDALRARVEPLDEAGRTAAFTAIVRTALAETLGVDVPESRDGRAFREAGLNSVGAVQLRNRLAAATGLELSAAVAFDHPTPAALAAFLRAGVLGETAPSRRALPARPPSDDDPVVLVGTACRYPGGIASPEDLWRVLDAGGHVMGPFPDDRGWDLAALAGGASATREGGFLSGAADFDAAFFGISPREALASDPQQRLLLESAWELFERAGIAPDSLHGTRTGVFAGVMYHDYGSGHAGPPQGTEAHWGVGTAGSVVSGRIAYQLGLEGPAITVDTACSSSLVALHLAAQSLRAGECDLAVAGGVTVMATPGSFVEFTRQGGLAPDGRCKPFAEAADGTAWSEGVGLLLLERQSDARRNGHEVLAVLRGSAVNSDGASNGLTAPNGPSQQRVIDAALAAAGLGPDDVDVVQAHGTGTTLGDPIEAEALRAAYGDRSEELLLGSVKANLGHTQAAAGAAGVIAMVQAMRHGIVPATPGADAPSSAVDWAAGPVRLVTAAEKWPDRDRPRRAAVSAFGISGTNAHVVLEQAPDSGTDPAREPAGTEAWFVSAATPEALDAHVGRITAVSGGLPRGDVAHALVHGRSRFEHRAVLLATDSGVREVARGRAVPRRVAVLVSGQGTQRPGMGRELYGRFPAFAEAFDEVLGHLRPGLREIVWGDDADRLARTGTAQPALFAFHVAAAALLRSWGVTPALTGGHSIGALAAAHLAGVLDLASAARLVTARGELMEALPGGGAMVAVEAGEDEVAAHLGPEVALAAVNGPSAVVLSGAADAVDAVAASFSARGRRTGRFPVSHAFHSHLMEPISVPLREVLDGLDLTPARIPVLSDVTGTVVDPAAPADPDYWVRHARGTVRFAGLVAAAAQAGVDTVVELGPDATLSGLVPDALPRARRRAGHPAVPGRPVRGGHRPDRGGPAARRGRRGASRGAGAGVRGAGAGAADLPVRPSPVLARTAGRPGGRGPRGPCAVRGVGTAAARAALSCQPAVGPGAGPGGRRRRASRRRPDRGGRVGRVPGRDRSRPRRAGRGVGGRRDRSAGRRAVAARRGHGRDNRETRHGRDGRHGRRGGPRLAAAPGDPGRCARRRRGARPAVVCDDRGRTGGVRGRHRGR